MAEIDLTLDTSNMSYEEKREYRHQLEAERDKYSAKIKSIYKEEDNKQFKSNLELVGRCYKRKRKHYNGEEDKDGLVRLTKYQYKTIRTKFGDSYVKKSFTELSNYIRFLEEHLNEKPVYKQQLKKYKSGTHNLELTKGWVYNKCKQYIMTEPVKLNVNPFMIEDYATAKAYIKERNIVLLAGFGYNI